MTESGSTSRHVRAGCRWHFLAMIGALASAMAWLPAHAQSPSKGFEPVPVDGAPGFVPVTPAAAAVKAEVAPKDRRALAGHYALLRGKDGMSDCTLTLDDTPQGHASYKASLSPTCKDDAMVVFDPASWEIGKGDLVLIAKSGSKTRLELQADGTWRKPSKDGTPLILKKM
jgi:Protease inhibitor Inh